MRHPFSAEFWRNRRAATAVAFAIMFVPMVICAGAAVDISRIAAARTLLQSSIDGAAIAGVSEWQMSESSTNAKNVATDVYQDTGAQLPNFVSSSTPTVTLACTGTTGLASQATNQCGGTAPFSASVIAGCPSNSSGIATFEYCVVVTASVTLKNSLLGFVVPSEFLSVSSAATANFPPSTISGKNIPSGQAFGSAGDKSGIYAYAVPMDGIGNSADYGELPAANSNCNSITGPLQNEPETAATNGVTSCNFLFLADSLSDSGNGGSITLAQNQPIAFAFVNQTGANGYTQINGAQYTTHIVVSTNSNGSNGTYYADGYAPVAYYTVSTTTTTTTYTYACTKYSNNKCSTYSTTATTSSSQSTSSTQSGTPGTLGNSCGAVSGKTAVNGGNLGSSYEYDTQTCKDVTSSTPSYQALYGECPDHTLYGSLSSSYGTPVADSLNEFSSAYEVIGYPPTHTANHVLLPYVTTNRISQSVNGTTYYVASVCPNYPTTGTSISAPLGTGYTNSSNGITAAMTANGVTPINVYSTWFPDSTFTDNSTTTNITSGSGDVYPPEIAACTAATSATDGGVTPSSDDPWWNWTGSNLGNCNNTAEPTNDNNCALLIEPLGYNAPTNSSGSTVLPDYYTSIKDSSGNLIALDPVYDNQTYIEYITGATPAQPGITVTVGTGTGSGENGIPVGEDQIKDTNAAGYVPTSTNNYAISTGIYSTGGYRAYEEPPATNGVPSQDHNLPAETSHQCYDPTQNGYSAALGGADNGTAVNQVENPQDGAVFCNTSVPASYALYWNDLGTYESDDIGYWNATLGFTCSTPANTNTGGGPATLSN